MTALVQAPVKLVAVVEEGVAALTAALGELDDVITLDSCRGNEARPASVSFRHAGGAWHAALFVADLGMALARTGGLAGYTLTAAWRPGAEEPTFRLTCPAAQAQQLADAVRASAWGREECDTALGQSDRELHLTVS
jgi:hypothetical protein